MMRASNRRRVPAVAPPCPGRLARRILAGAVLILGATTLTTVARATEYEDGEIVLGLVPGANIDEVNQTWGTITLDGFPEGDLYLVYRDGIEDIEAYADTMVTTDPRIDEAEANYRQDTPEGVRQMVVVAVGGDIVDYEDQAITDRIQLDAAHTYATGEGITVGMLDTGVDPDHEALAGRIAPGGWDFVDDDAFPWEEANGIDEDLDQQTDDGYGHGTMVAGILALVAPDATILPVRVLDDEGRSSAWRVAKGIRHAVNQGVDVLNLSLGVPQTMSVIGHQVDAALDAGIVVVAAAGNENRENPAYYPASDSDVFMVTALDSTDVKADFADWNSAVLVSAPGTGVRSAFPGGQWALGSGCSFATPFVVGEVVLVRSLAYHLTPDEVEERVEMGVDPIYHLAGNGDYLGKLGSGRINVLRTVQGLVVAIPITPPSSRVRAMALPNPTRGAVTLRSTLPERGDRPLVAEIFDVQGRRVARVTGPSGQLRWNGSRDAGTRRAPAGTYFARISNGEAREWVGFRVLP